MRKTLPAVLLLSIAGFALAGSREEAIQEIKASFVKMVKLDEAYWATPEGARRGMQSSYQVERVLVKEPLDLLVEAIEQAIRTGTRDEKCGGIGTYTTLVYDRKIKPKPEYLPIFLDLLANDKGGTDHFKFVLVNALHWYPTRETVLAYADVAERSTDIELQHTALSWAASMMGMHLAIYSNAPPGQNEKRIVDFLSWIRRNEERIRFNKRGHFRLAGGEVSEDREVLRKEDRARIRKDPAGVLSLFSQIMGDEDDSSADLTGECAAALLGPEGAALMAKRAALAREGKEPTREMEARLGSYEGSYPVVDAALLAAVYVVAYEKDPAALKAAREMLVRATREDVRRVAGSEPRAVRRKAERLARGRGAEED